MGRGALSGWGVGSFIRTSCPESDDFSEKFQTGVHTKAEMNGVLGKGSGLFNLMNRLESEYTFLDVDRSRRVQRQTLDVRVKGKYAVSFTGYVMDAKAWSI